MYTGNGHAEITAESMLLFVQDAARNAETANAENMRAMLASPRNLLLSI